LAPSVSFAMSEAKNFLERALCLDDLDLAIAPTATHSA
jgi:hypothetical protein